jgi:hypothetical protein
MSLSGDDRAPPEDHREDEPQVDSGSRPFSRFSLNGGHTCTKPDPSGDVAGDKDPGAKGNRGGSGVVFEGAGNGEAPVESTGASV